MPNLRKGYFYSIPHGQRSSDDSSLWRSGIFSSSLFDEAAAVRFVHTDVGIHQVTGSVLKSLHSGLHCLRFVPVIAVDDTDDLSGRMADSLIHGIIDAVVRFAEDVITDPLA